MALQFPLFDVLKTWHDFFLLVGGASATLLGLIFISVAIVANLSEVPPGRDLFASPIVMRFTLALVLSAICLGPWHDPRGLGGLLMGLATVALVQSLARIFRFRRFQATTKKPTASVWLQIVLAPLILDVLCMASGLLIWKGDLRAIAGIAVIAIAMTMLGLRNTWTLFIWMLELHHHSSRTRAEPAAEGVSAGSIHPRDTNTATDGLRPGPDGAVGGSEQVVPGYQGSRGTRA